MKKSAEGGCSWGQVEYGTYFRAGMFVEQDDAMFLEILKTARVSYEEGTAEQMTCDLDQLCYTLGWGLYWYLYGSEIWSRQNDDQAFGNRCLDYYCSCVELQRKSIFKFLLCWNRTTGVKGPGQMIAQIVWNIERIIIF
jgi:hypothetical protein